MKLLKTLLAALVVTSTVGASTALAKLDAHGVNERPKKTPVAQHDLSAPDPTNTSDDVAPTDDDNTDSAGALGSTLVGPGDIEDTPIGECTADLNGDGNINVEDIVIVFLNWGPCDGTCAADSNGDQIVDVMDLIGVVSAWGVCLP